MKRLVNFTLVVILTMGGVVLNSCSKKDDGGGESDSVFANIGVKTKGFKTVTTTHYNASDDGKGGVAKGNKTSMDIESYDKLGRVIEERSFKFSGGKEVLTGKDVHSYNGGVWRTISYKDENNQYKERETIMTFDNAGRIIEMEMLDAKDNSSSKSVNHYDGNKLIETKHYKDGKYVSTWKYNYKESLREATIYNIDPTGKEVETLVKVKVFIDDKGKEINIIPTSFLVDKEMKMSFELNEKGDIKRIMVKNIETGEEFVAIYQYEYNERGHWTKQTVTMSMLGSVYYASIEEREIEYY